MFAQLLAASVFTERGSLELVSQSVKGARPSQMQRGGINDAIEEHRGSSNKSSGGMQRETITTKSASSEDQRFTEVQVPHIYRGGCRVLCDLCTSRPSRSSAPSL